MENPKPQIKSKVQSRNNREQTYKDNSPAEAGDQEQMPISNTDQEE